MWVVDIIENCITLWNSTLSSIWSMLTQSPETFHNGAVWDAITKIFTALQGAGYGLLVLFFAMSFFKHTVSFREFRHPEQIIGYLIRFVAAKVLISQGMEVIKLIFKISGSFIGDIAAQMGGLTEIAATLPENIRNAIEDASIIPQIFIYLWDNRSIFYRVSYIFRQSGGNLCQTAHLRCNISDKAAADLKYQFYHFHAL